MATSAVLARPTRYGASRSSVATRLEDVDVESLFGHLRPPSTGETGSKRETWNDALSP
jgi:hypothetical protein